MDFLSPDRVRSINISEGPLLDDHATKEAHRDIKGVFTIVGNDIPTKAVFGVLVCMILVKKICINLLCNG